MKSKNINELKIEKILFTSSKKVRAERIALGLTQEEFSDFVNIKYSTYKCYEQKGKISFENYIKILIRINKYEQFAQFLDNFEFNEQKERASSKNTDDNDEYLKPIISVSQKYIILDKEVFGSVIFYSVADGHRYEIPRFISIVLNKWNEQRLMLLIKYFGVERLRPYILNQKDTKLLKSFNKHINFIIKRNK